MNTKICPHCNLAVDISDETSRIHRLSIELSAARGAVDSLRAWAAKWTIVTDALHCSPETSPEDVAHKIAILYQNRSDDGKALAALRAELEHAKGHHALCDQANANSLAAVTAQWDELLAACKQALFAIAEDPNGPDRLMNSEERKAADMCRAAIANAERSAKETE